MPDVAYDTPVYQSRTLGTHYMIHKLRALGALIPLGEISYDYETPVSVL